MLSELVITKEQYHKFYDNITWENCTLRCEYLNNKFYNTFCDSDKKRIVETSNHNPSNLWYYTAGGNDTRDKIFILGLEEVDKYFGNSGDYVKKRRKQYYNGFVTLDYYNGQCFCNIYDLDRIAKDLNGEMYWWWLRSPGLFNIRAAYVGNVGSVFVCGDFVSNIFGGVRPALWLNL